jgi:hypothetical protein
MARGQGAPPPERGSRRVLPEQLGFRTGWLCKYVTDRVADHNGEEEKEEGETQTGS